jgi:hypothetical protein
MKSAAWMLALGLAACPAASAWAAEGDGLTPNAGQLPWSRWEARLLLGGAAPTWRADLGAAEAAGLNVRSVSLLGDFYFARSMRPDGTASGFRTTSGLIVGPRSAPWSALSAGLQPKTLFSADRRLFGASAATLASEPSDSSTLPYLGIGYSGLSLRGGWSVSADLGLVALAPGQAVKLGRVFSGTQALDEMLRDLRLSPVLQLGVSYAF